MVKKVVVVTLILTVLAFGTISYALTTEKPHTQPTVAKQTVVELSKYDDTHVTPQELLELVNKERTKVNVAPLTIDDRLNQSAQYKADDMAKYNYFSHVSTHDGQHGYVYMRNVGVSCAEGSENIQITEHGTTTDALDWWLHSKPHYKAMINPEYTTTGFGISQPPKVLDYEKPTISVEHFCREA